ncbi:FAD-dependent monooxygenase [Dokdonia sp.]|uniref:FAD-dependent monooxygenase n=1 Tax=Dokdonia sp. TaxID=2024995 RepID=UPI003265718C
MYSIIGGGIGGLTTALAFEKLGIEYQLFEKAEQLIPVGSGILLPPNSLQVFEWLGILDDVSLCGSVMKQITLTKPDMTPLFDYAQEDVKEMFGFYAISIHRWELQNVLLKKIPTHKIHLGKSLDTFKQIKEKVHLTFLDGTKIETDFLLGADGIQSNIRKQLFPKSKTRYSGQTCWRGICNYEDLAEEYNYRGIEMWGEQARFGITKIEENTFYWFAVVLSPQNQKDVPNTITDILLKTFANFHPVVGKLIGATHEEKIIRSDLNDVKPMPYWYKGNICLLGDAAHATTPNMGQGGAQAIEDAYYLAKAICQESKSHAFSVFQQNRSKKVNLIVRQSLLMGIIGHWKYFVWLRNFILTYTPSSIFKIRWRSIYTLKNYESTIN